MRYLPSLRRLQKTFGSAPNQTMVEEVLAVMENVIQKLANSTLVPSL
jgi:hypothetical protein